MTDGALPRHPDRWPSFPELAAAVGAPTAGVAGPPWRAPDGTVTNVLVGSDSTLAGAAWVPLASVEVPGLADSWSAWADGFAGDGRAAWFVRGWVESVVSWIDSLGLDRVGPPEPVKLWSLSAVLRIPVATGELFFKATCDGFRTEPALTSVVRRLAPDVAPALVAVDEERGWMLMAPIPGASDGVPAAQAADVARRLARLQLDTLPARPALLAAGVPDRGLEATLAMLGTVVHASVDVLTDEQRARAVAIEPWLVTAVRDFWSAGLPDVLAHGDLHLGNVAWVDDGPLLFDWTDACLTHPFLDAKHLADSAASDGADDGLREVVWAAYAEAWRAACPDVDLDAVWARVRVAEGVFQAVTYEQIYRAQPEGSRWELATVVGEILDKLADVRDGRR